MRKVTISFDDEFEDKTSIKNAVNADEMSFFIWDLFQEFRNLIKYNNEELTSETIEELDTLRDKLFDDLRERGLEYILEG
jgi:hypothetical protein